MKMEEVDLVSIHNTLKPPHPSLEPQYSIQEIEQMEREVLNVLKFKLIPDTLNFWLDLSVKLWDLFVEYEAEYLGCHIYKPREVYKDLNRYEAARQPF